jgi:hypothetical protein
VDNNDDNKLSGTLLVNCSGSACKNVMRQSEKMEAVTFDVSGSKDQIKQVESSIRKIDGVHSVNHEIGSSLLY